MKKLNQEKIEKLFKLRFQKGKKKSVQVISFVPDLLITTTFLNTHKNPKADPTYYPLFKVL